MPKHSAEQPNPEGLPLDTNEVFGPDVGSAVSAELVESQTYSSLMPAERIEYRERKLLARRSLVDMIHTSKVYKDQIARLSEEEAVSQSDEVLAEQEARLQGELDALQKKRRHLGSEALGSDNE